MLKQLRWLIMCNHMLKVVVIFCHFIFLWALNSCVVMAKIEAFVWHIPFEFDIPSFWANLLSYPRKIFRNFEIYNFVSEILSGYQIFYKFIDFYRSRESCIVNFKISVKKYRWTQNFRLRYTKVMSFAYNVQKIKKI